MAHLPDGATTLVRVIDCWVSTPVCTVQPCDESPDKSPNASGLLHFSRAKSLALDPHLFPHRSTMIVGRSTVRVAPSPSQQVVTSLSARAYAAIPAYDEGKDNNLTRIARLIARLGFFPLCGRGLGLRQPVHTEDCAIAAVNAAQSIRAENKIYELPGGETITYRKMIGRIFDGVQRRRLIVPVPPPLWLGLFHLVQRHYPGIKAEMGARMATDLTFDRSLAVADLDWHPRAFRPTFDGLAGPRIFAWPYRPGALICPSRLGKNSHPLCSCREADDSPTSSRRRPISVKVVGT
jgi:hypothetical protein